MYENQKEKRLGEITKEIDFIKMIINRNPTTRTHQYYPALKDLRDERNRLLVELRVKVQHPNKKLTVNYDG